jgi:hypothetical protein
VSYLFQGRIQGFGSSNMGNGGLGGSDRQEGLAAQPKMVGFGNPRYEAGDSDRHGGGAVAVAGAAGKAALSGLASLATSVAGAAQRATGGAPTAGSSSTPAWGASAGSGASSVGVQGVGDKWSLGGALSPRASRRKDSILGAEDQVWESDS